jgi:hypothetical protein
VGFTKLVEQWETADNLEAIVKETEMPKVLEYFYKEKINPLKLSGKYMSHLHSQ